MIVFWLLVFVAYEGLRGGAHQTATDARTGIRNVRQTVKARTAARFRMWDASVRQRKPYAPTRIAWGTAKATYKTGTYGITATRATARGVRRAHRSWRTGWSAGAAKGRQRHTAYVARRDLRRAAAREAQQTASPMRPFPVAEQPHTAERDVHTALSVPDDSDPVTGAGEPTPSALPEGNLSVTTSTGGEALNIDQARQTLKEIYSKASDFVSAVDTLSASLQAADMDSQTLGEVAEILDAASATQAAADKAVRGLDTRHAHMEEAVNSTPHAAKTDFYRH